MLNRSITREARMAGLPALCLLLLAAAPAPASGQNSEGSSGEPDPMAEARQVFLSSAYVHERQSAALQLWLTGEHDPAYFEFLQGEADEAIGQEIPFPLATGEDGRLIRGELAEDFLAWVAVSGVSLEDEVARQVREHPRALVALGATLDPQAAPVLESALDSPNPFVVAAAAEGLARMEVQSALPRLLELARDDSPDVALPVALQLLYYDDPEAQAVAEAVIADPPLVDEMRDSVIAWRETREQLTGGAAGK